MALIKTLSADESPVRIELPNLYWRVSKILVIRNDVEAGDNSVDKEIIALLTIHIYPEKPEFGTKIMTSVIEEVPFEELYAQEGDDLYAKAYGYIKTLDEYADAVDV